MDISKKKILFIAPQFYGYEKEIEKELEKAGAIVYYVQDNIEDTSFLYRVLGKIQCAFTNRLRDWKIKKNIDYALNGRIVDYVFGIRLDTLNDNTIRYLKEKTPNALYICYFWDSVKNMRASENVADAFDKVFTFDSNDVKEHPSWILRPLFYCNDFNASNEIKGNFEYDLLFVASLSRHRAQLFSELQSYCTDNSLVLKTVFVCKWYLFALHWLKYPEYRKLPKSIIRYKGLSRKEIAKTYSMSRVVFDSSSPNQHGLTMRTLECFGAKKKMITTNNSIMDYDIYNPINILLYSRENIGRIKDFIRNEDWSEAAPITCHYYSLRGWVESIFNEI